VRTKPRSPSRPGDALNDDPRLIQILQELLADGRGAPAVVRDLRRTPSPFATLWPTEILSVGLESGERLSLFVKHLGTGENPHPDKLRPERELLVYERVLDEDGPAAPRCYGTRVDSESGRFELYLEHIADWDLRYQGLEHWVEAARVLARLHRTFAGRVDEHDFLLSLDREYLLAWALRAAAAVQAGPAGLGRRLEALLATYAPVADLLAAQPRTLVHNDLAPKNVLADRSRAPARICLVDWEVAGAGCGLLDLVHLAYGLDEDQEQRLIDAYRGALDGAPVLASGLSDDERLLAAARLHKALYRLAHPHLWRARPALAAAWVAEAERAREAV
jgi:hypothetical protein